MASTDRQLFRAGHVTIPPGYENQEINLADLWRMLVDGKWIIFFAVSISTILAATIALLMTPIFRGEVLLAARSEESGLAASLGGTLGGLASIAGVPLGADDGERTQAIAMLRSRTFAEQFIRERDLLPVLFGDIWDSKTKSWVVDDPEEIPTMHKAVRRFLEDVRSVSEDTDTGLVTLAMQWNDRELVAEWANDFVQMLNAEMRHRAISEAEKSIAYLQEEASKTSVVELERAIYSLVEEQIQAIMLANVREQFAFEILDPAVVPDPDERVQPKTLLMIVLGFMLGMILGVAAIFIRNALRSMRIPESGNDPDPRTRGTSRQNDLPSSRPRGRPEV